MAAWIAILVICLASGIATTGHAASAAGDLHFKKQDLEFILKQIVISERHANGEALEAILPNLSVPWGLRTIDGSYNNLIGGQTQFGAADEEFLQLVAPTYDSAQILEKLHPECAGTMSDPCTLAPNDVLGAETSYVRGDGRTTQDSTARLISNLIVNQSTDNPAAAAAAAMNENSSLETIGFADTQFIIPNSAPDEGLSAPFNLFMTFFGQFFDHGLDLINKGGNGLVFIPLAEDDPLYDPDSTANFMLMPRATKDCGDNGLCGDDDDGVGHINATTPHVDQQQTYASHASAHILLRHYEFGPCLTAPAAELSQGCLQSSGDLLNGFGNDRMLDTSDDGGMATWDTAQAQASMKMGITLDDFDGANIPMFAADAYGKFIPGPQSGLPQLVTGTDPLVLVEGNLTTPVDASQALRVNHSFFLDVAHSANPGAFKGVGVEPDKAPDENTVLNPRTDSLSGQPTRGIRAPGIPLPCTGENCVGQSTYDDELLGAHFVCGDGRCNENIALTTIHTLFHSEHNRLAYVTKRVVLDSNDPAFLNEWLDTELAPTEFADLMVAWTAAKAVLTDISDASRANQAATATAIDGLDLDWNGERVFQTARFGTEMQYNRVVFDEFVPTLAGLKDPFEGFHTNVNPSITAEFSQQVYRFGHSMLNQDVWRYDADFNTIVDPGALDSATAGDQLGLFEAFLNPLALYNYSDNLGEYTLTPEQGTGAVIRGLTRQFGNEVDEFVTGGMQNNLVGLPLDIGAINIARGRDVGTARLNKARRAFFAATQDSRLAPYVSWSDYGDNIRHEASLVNFVAAYGTHPSVAGDDRIIGNGDTGEPSTVADRRAAACALVSSQSVVESFCSGSGFGAAPVPADADAFMRSAAGTAWAAVDGLPVTGLEDIDFWNGGLAEERFPFQGYLGSTHNFVFENQMENLQNGDRFYYVGRTSTIPLFGALESNTFASLAMRNTDLGDFGAGTLPLGLFSRPNHNLEVDQSQQFNTTTNSSADPDNENELFALVIRDPALVTTNITIADPLRFIQYTGGDHVVIGGTEFDDTIIGGIGDDSLWGREGNDRIEGGDGADHIEGGPGDDIITDLAGPDVIEGGPGNDAIASGNEEDVIFGDDGHDFIINASEFGEIFAGPGNDFILDGVFLGHIRGGTGDDWMENLGGGEDLFQGDTGAAPEGGEPGHKGNDVLISHAGNNDGDMENGDDIVVDGPGIDRVEGQLGFDWVSFQNDEFGVSVDLDLSIFTRPVLPVSNASILNRYDRVEGISGSPKGDVLRGTANGPDSGNELSVSFSPDPSMSACAKIDVGSAEPRTTDGFALIEGLNGTATALPLVPMNERRDLAADVVTGDAQCGWTGGEIIIGGGSSDLLVGEGGDDIFDGDSALDVHLSVPMDPGMMGGALNNAKIAAQNAFNAATTARDNAQLADDAADMADTAASNDLATEIGGLTDEASMLLETANTTQVAADAAAQLAAGLAATAVLEEVNAAAVQQAAVDASAFLVSWQASMDAAMDDTVANDAAVMDTAAASGVAAQAATDAAAATAAAQAAANTAAATYTAASQAAIDALFDLIQGIMTEADVNALTAVATTAFEANNEAQAFLTTAQMTQATADAAATAAVTAHNQAVVDALAASTNVAEMAERVQAAAVLNQAAQNAADEATVNAMAARATANSSATDATAAQGIAATAATAAAAAAMDVAGLQQTAAAAAALRAITSSNLELRDNDLAVAQSAFDTADTALTVAMAGNGPFLVAGMRDLQEAVFAGNLNPGDISISRVINDHDPDNLDTDVVYFSGNFADYCIETSESDIDTLCAELPDDEVLTPGGEAVLVAEIGDSRSRDPLDEAGVRFGDLDGFIEVNDLRDLPLNLRITANGNEGRDLLRNIERLVFQDVVILVPVGAAGAADPNLNSVAVGLAQITTMTPTPPAVWDTLTASLDMVTDADNCMISVLGVDLGCGIDGTVAYYWQVELEPGSGYYTNIERLDGIAGNGDVVEATGNTVQLSVDEAGLFIRVLAIFQDDAGVFETVKSDSYITPIPPGFAVPDGLLGLIPATFLGDAADIANAIAVQDLVATPLFENASRIGGARIDLTIAEVPLALFSNTGFGAEVGALDEVLVAGMLLTFTDSEGNVLGTFTPEIIAIVDPLTGDVEQDIVDISFSIRGDAVAPLVVPPFSIATLTINGTVVANATFFGDSSVNSATGITPVLVNQSPLLVDPGTILASFIGGDTDLGPLSFATGATLEADGFTVRIADVSASLFSQVPAANGPGIPVAEGITLEFRQLIPVAPATNPQLTGLFRPTIVSGSSPGTVDVLWFIDDVGVEPLVDGLARMSVLLGGLPGDVAEAVTLFGDSGADAGADVMLLSTLAQQRAAAELVIAELDGNPGHIEDATAALLTATLAALGENAPDAAAAQLALEPHANFVGEDADLSLPIFENVGRDGLARFDFTIPDVPLALFQNTGFGPTILVSDEILVDRIALMFSRTMNRVTGVILPEAVAIQNPINLEVNQTHVDIMWSIRGVDVAPLVVGSTTVSVLLDGDPVATMTLSGDSRVGDALMVMQMTGLATTQAAGALASALVLGDPVAASVARVDLAAAIAAIPPTPPVPFICHLHTNDPNVAQGDADADGTGDPCDNCRFAANGLTVGDLGGNMQRDTDADGFGNVCDPDLDNNGVVNFGDFVRFQAGWGTSNPDLDFNGDGVVNFGDLSILSNYMFGVPGENPAP